MPTVRIPSQLRNIVGGERKLEVAGSTIRSILDEIDNDHPGFKNRILDEKGDPSAFVGVYIDGDDIRFLGGLDADVPKSSEVSIVPAAAGGNFESY